MKRWQTGVTAALVLGAGAAWWLIGSHHAPTSEDTKTAAPEPPKQARPLDAPSPATLEASIEQRADHAPEPHEEESRHPHPLTPERDRIQRELQLVGALNDAVDLVDPGRIRQVLEVYRSEFKEDPHALQSGYAVIADCLDAPGSASLAAARRYYEKERASTLRRFVRRHCFSGKRPD